MTASPGALLAPPGISSLAWKIYRSALVVDMHDDLPSRMLDDVYDPAMRHPAGFTSTEGHSDLPRFMESGVTAVWLAAFVGARYTAQPGASFARAAQILGAIRDFVAHHPDALIAATRAEHVQQAKAGGRVAVFAGVEGGHAIEHSLDRLGDLYALGARYLTLTWNNGNSWAGSSLGEGGTSTGGLTDFGREVVREMNRLGMLVDVSHVSDATLRDVLDVSAQPVVASHSCARALCDHPRNLTDQQLRDIAAAGGVACLNFYSRFLCPAWGPAVDAGTPPPAVTIAHLADHLAHMVSVAGAAHVGLGSDFNGLDALPDGMHDVTRLPWLAEALVRRGFGEAELRGVLGGNVVRVIGQVIGE